MFKVNIIYEIKSKLLFQEREVNAMNIELPKEFSMEDERKGQKAYIENGILKLTRQVNFSILMVEISYQLKGKDKCSYCGKEVLEEEITIDHMFPVNFGGPTITNNLAPACKECNSEKGNMTVQQYITFLESKSIGLEKDYQRCLKKYQEGIRKKGLYQIPNEWITNKEITDIINVISLTDDYKKKRYRSLEKYYKEYGIIKNPIIIDKNSFLLDGFLTLMVAKNYNTKSVPVIQLDNVETIL